MLASSAPTPEARARVSGQLLPPSYGKDVVTGAAGKARPKTSKDTAGRVVGVQPWLLALSRPLWRWHQGGSPASPQPAWREALQGPSSSPSLSPLHSLGHPGEVQTPGGGRYGGEGRPLPPELGRGGPVCA